MSYSKITNTNEVKLFCFNKLYEKVMQTFEIIKISMFYILKRVIKLPNTVNIFHSINCTITILQINNHHVNDDE